jgi:hypothetical protein
MEATPFPHQGPLAPEQVHGRDELLDDLIGKVTARQVTALLGPRRFGKTSVLGRLAADLSEVTTVRVDLYGATSVMDVVGRLDATLDASHGPFQQTARVEAAKLQLTLGVARVEMARPARDRPEPAAMLHNLLDVLVAAALSTPTLLVLDEFSAVRSAGSTTAVLRTKLQHHYRDIGLVFAGSEPSVMRTLFTDVAEPFFGQADLVEIGPLPATAVLSMVGDGFASTGRDPGGAPSLVYQLTRGHPQRTMLAAHTIWTATPPGATATDEVVVGALEQLRSRVDAELRAGFEHHSTGAQQVLRLVAHGQPVHGARAGAIDLGKNTATHHRDRLIADGHLRNDPGRGLEVTDPLLRDWLRRQLPL